MSPHAEVVIVGGGIVGCALLYELTRQGLTDVLLLEKSELTAGTTWHSAGHLVVLEENPAVARINALSFGIYSNFETETGEPIGRHACGSLQIARSRSRYDRLERLLPKMQALGHSCRMVTPEEMRELFPLLDPRGLLGASWASTEGYIDPSMATHAFARLARAAGARINQHTRVTELERAAGRWRLQTTTGAVTAERVVLATGMWVPELPSQLGISLPVVPAERQYVVTDDMPEVKALSRELPILRDYDAPLYFRQERHALIMGVHEPHTPYCFEDGIPLDFGKELLAPDLDRGTACIEAGMALVPAFARAGIKRVICGPTSRTVDFNGLVGPLWSHPGLYVLAGFSAGVGQGAGAARLLSEWIVKGAPSLDISPLDVARFGPYATVYYMRQCLGEAHTYGSLDEGKERAAGRPARASPLYHRHRAARAAFVVRNGWECPAWFRTADAPDRRTAIAAECEAARKSCGLADISARAVLSVTGADADALIARLIGKRPELSVGFSVLIALPLRGVDPATPITITRDSAEGYSLVAPPEIELRLLERLTSLAEGQKAAIVENRTGHTGLLLLFGPESGRVVRAVTPRGFDETAIRSGEVVGVNIGFAPARIRRRTTSAAEALEIEVAGEYLVGVDEVLRQAGDRDLVRDIGLDAVAELTRA